MPVFVRSRRCKKETLLAEFGPDVVLLDVTSRGELPWQRCSPFYPVGDIPVPGMANATAESVEGLWQGLKVFATAGIDTDKFNVRTLKNLKRTQRRFGKCLGHQYQGRLLGYLEARRMIYVPSYTWVVQNRLQSEAAHLRALAVARTVVLLDYETNGDVDNLSSPLSHAALLVRLVLSQL
jgi:hypothetical protein